MGARKSEKLSSRAIIRGLEFIYSTTADAEDFRSYGYDYLFSFYQISVTSQDSTVRRIARQMALDCARRWRKVFPTVEDGADPDSVVQMIFDRLAVDNLGFEDKQLKSRLADLACQFTCEQYFWFDPRIEPPPLDVPAECGCGASNARGATHCLDCGQALQMMSAYEVWVVALIRSYLGERYGVTLGARHSDVLRWVPVMRPYPPQDCASYNDFLWAVYAATHITYTLNDYNIYGLRPGWLPAEFAFLQRSLGVMIAKDDPDAVGEIMDSLKSYGLTKADRMIEEGTHYLLSRQNPDGSWDAPDAVDVYDRYHPTLAAINGLDECVWRGHAPRFAEMERLLAEAKVDLRRAAGPPGSSAVRFCKRPT